MCAAGGFDLISCRVAVKLSEILFNSEGISVPKHVCVSEQDDFVNYIFYFSQQRIWKAQQPLLSNW